MNRNEQPGAAFGRFEDAHRRAKETAAVLSKFFEGAGHMAGDNDLEMFAALGHETMALAIMKNLDVMSNAMHELLEMAHEAQPKKGRAS